MSTDGASGGGQGTAGPYGAAPQMDRRRGTNSWYYTAPVESNQPSPTNVDTSGKQANGGVTPTAAPKKPEGDAFGGVVLSRNKRPLFSAFQAALSLGLRRNA